jgi:ABC-type branched-subunit amino acid transport system substrate-binding protein
MQATRRSFGQACAALVAASALRPAFGAQAEWTVLQPAPLTGVNGGVGWHLRLGAMLAFDAANAAGGVHGRPLKLLTLDEERGRVAAQVRDAAKQSSAVALLGLNGRGTLGELARSNTVAELGLPVVGVKSGSASGPGFDSPWLFVTRGGYRAEIDQVFRHASTIYARRVALVTTQDDDGDEIAAIATVEAQHRGVELFVAPRHPTDTAQVADAVAAVLATPHDAVLLATNTAAVAYFAKLYRAGKGRGQLITLSSAEATQLALVVGPEAARGMVISQVVPHPRDPKLKLMREFMSAWQRYMPDAVNPTLTMTEGYVAARVLIDGLQRCGANANGAALAAALAGASKSPFDIDGLRVSLQREGPHFRSLSVIGGDGHVLF